jgi:hypothetical protein
MSAIDFRTSVKRKADPKGDRVVITMDGKVCTSRTDTPEWFADVRVVWQFLPYSLTGEGNPWTREGDE